MSITPYGDPSLTPVIYSSFGAPAEKREGDSSKIKTLHAKIGQQALKNEWKRHSNVEVGNSRWHDVNDHTNLSRVIGD